MSILMHVVMHVNGIANALYSDRLLPLPTPTVHCPSPPTTPPPSPFLPLLCTQANYRLIFFSLYENVRGRRVFKGVFMASAYFFSISVCEFLGERSTWNHVSRSQDFESRGHFFLAVFCGVTHEGLSERGTTGNLRIAWPVQRMTEVYI